MHSRLRPNVDRELCDAVHELKDVGWIVAVVRHLAHGADVIVNKLLRQLVDVVVWHPDGKASMKSCQDEAVALMIYPYQIIYPPRHHAPLHQPASATICFRSAQSLAATFLNFSYRA
jgi:hypothetical protein